MQKVITDDLDALLGILPPQTRQKLHEQEDFKQLIEVILDLGRPAEARFLNREVLLCQFDDFVFQFIMHHQFRNGGTFPAGNN